MALENLICEHCGERYHGDPAEVRLCLTCDEDRDERNVTVFCIDSFTDIAGVSYGTLEDALAAADAAGLADIDFVVDERDPISYHGVDVHYRNDAHREAYQAAMREAARIFREERTR